MKKIQRVTRVLRAQIENLWNCIDTTKGFDKMGEADKQRLQRVCTLNSTLRMIEHEENLDAAERIHNLV